MMKKDSKKKIVVVKTNAKKNTKYRKK